MASLTPEDAIIWLSNSNYDRGLGGEIANIQIARRGMASFPPDSQAYKAHQQVMENSLARVEKAQEDESYEAAGIDPAFNNAACDCEPGEPCCLRAFEVADNKDKSRKIIWPVPKGDPSKLFVITKDAYNGSPSAKVEVKMTDFEKCKQRKDLTPWIFSGTGDEFADDPLLANPTGSVVKTVTSPFQVPAVLTALFPEEVLYAIYVAGYYISYSAYKTDDLPKLSPTMCMTDGQDGIYIHPVPHVKLQSKVTGKVAVEFFFDGLPTLSAALEGNVKGEVGNQVIDYTASANSTIAEKRPTKAGPVNHSLLGTIAKIYEKVDWMAEKGGSGPPTASGIPNPVRSSITLGLGCEIEIAKVELKGKSASPDLELKVDPIKIRMELSVKGKMDLLDMLIGRVPKLADSLREARRALAEEGRVGQIKLECSLTLEASGGVEMGLQNGATVTIGSQDGWEHSFDNLAARFQADAKIIGELKIVAKIGVNTWFFDGGASVEGSVSTGWHFGGRTTANTDGTQKHESLYYFEGLRVQGSYEVHVGEEEATSESPTFPTGNSSTTGTTTRKHVTDNRVTLLTGSFDEAFFDSEGGPDDWTET